MIRALTALTLAIIGLSASPGRAAEPTRGEIEAVQLQEKATPGVCVDKAFAAVQQLKALGVDVGALPFVVIRLDKDTAHMIVHLPSGLVLDNRYRGLVEWSPAYEDAIVTVYPAGESLAILHSRVWR